MSEDNLNEPTSSMKSIDLTRSYSQTSTLKRQASPSFEDDEQHTRRKRLREEDNEDKVLDDKEQNMNDARIADELVQELQCGCCSELVYRPVLVMPCQHFFCGSCCVLWIRNGGTNCPACRGVSTIVTPFRALQGVVDTLLRIAPEKARTERERLQADEIYKSGLSLRIPSPREASPEPNLNQNNDYAHPCPHCAAGNPHGWRCQQPIPDPVTDPDHAWPLDDGVPPGHSHCGNCDNLLALEAPITSKCDFCQVSFCGINVPGRCSAVPLLLQHPQGLSAVSDLIESSEVYDCFDGNTYEVEIMFDYLRPQNFTPRNIYRAIVMHVAGQPRGFLPLIESELFSDIHGGLSGTEPLPQGPFNKICRVCAAEVLLWGLRDWWIRERQKGFLEASITSRNDCPEGSSCPRQKDTGHAREFNHMIAPQQAEELVNPPPAPVPEMPASGSMDATAEIVHPQTQEQVVHNAPSDPGPALSSMSSLSFLLNATESDEGEMLDQSFRSSTPDFRDAVNALS